jgi:hypothetical protein
LANFCFRAGGVPSTGIGSMTIPLLPKLNRLPTGLPEWAVGIELEEGLPFALVATYFGLSRRFGCYPGLIQIYG